MKKIFLIGGSAVVLGIIAMIVLAILNLGSIIKTATETYGPQITKTEVKLGSADISILSGSGSLDDFLLGNPKGFPCRTRWSVTPSESRWTPTP